MNQITRIAFMLFALLVVGTAFAPAASAQRYHHRRHHRPHHYHHHGRR